MLYYGLIPLQAYAAKLPDFYSVASPPITDSVFKGTITTKTLPTLPSPIFSPETLPTFSLLASEEKIEKERARLVDELNRGYFDDISKLKQHGGKITLANKILILGIAARKFPAMDVIYSDGRKSKLPIVFDASGIDASKLAVPEASLVCLSFRANSQAMVDS
ncbi:hypothetical protein PVK06_020052 [Gossypium arboreum]|uniref:Uncharacterized protein n=1 Tax=Gossypium arboreum TaxID=29729 RepID=A0ABR0PLD3_GOSAR|nr:hypothetical protein PVK06_020052 [Gossypium arboreum]